MAEEEVSLSDGEISDDEAEATVIPSRQNMYTMISPSKSSDAESGPPNDGSMEQDDFQVALYAYQTLHSILIKNGGSGFDALAEVFGNTNESEGRGDSSRGWTRSGGPLVGTPCRNERTGGFKLFAANLAPSVDSERLRTLFGEHGKVMDVFVKEGASGGKIAFVTLESQEIAEKAGTLLAESLLEGRPLHINWARGRNSNSNNSFGSDGNRTAENGDGPRNGSDSKKIQGEPCPDDRHGGYKVHVVGLADSVDDSKLREIFGAFGTVKDAFLKEGGSGKFAFVTMETQEEAEKAGAGLGGKEVEGSRLKVQWAKPRADGGGGRGGGRGGRGGGGGSSTCFGCGQSGHRKADCPGNGSAGASSSTQSSGWGDAAPAPATTSASSDGWGTTPAASDASAPADSGWRSVPAAPALAAPAGDTGGWGSAPASAPASAAPSGGWGDSAASTEPSGSASGGGWGSAADTNTASSGWGSSDAVETKSSGWGSGGGGGGSSGSSFGGRPPRESRPMQGDPCPDERHGGYKVHVVGLADSIDDSKLREIFGAFGTVKDAFLKEGASGKFAFVTLETQEEAEKAGAGLGGKEIEGSRLKVQWAKPRADGGGGRGGGRGGRGGGGGSSTCFGCGQSGHRKADCPGSGSAAGSSSTQSSGWGDAAPAPASTSASSDGWGTTPAASDASASADSGWGSFPAAPVAEAPAGDTGGWGSAPASAPASAAPSGGWGDSAASTEPSGVGGWGSTADAGTASSGWGSSNATESTSSGWGSGGGGGGSSGSNFGGRPPRESRPMQGDPCADDRNGGYKVHVVGLADGIDDSKLREIFGAFGTVKDAFLKEGASGKFAFVTLETQEEAEKAGAGLGGKEVEGSRLKVQWAKPRADGGGGRGGGRGGRGGGGGSSTCFGCGQSGHRKADCPGSGSAGASSSTQSSGWGDAAPAPATTSASSDGWGTTPAASDASAPAGSGWRSVPAAPATAAPAGDTCGWGSAPASAPASAAPSGGWGDSAASTEPSGSASGGGWGSAADTNTASSGWGSSDAVETKSSGWGSGGGGGGSSGSSFGGRPPRESRPMQGDPCPDERHGGYKVHVVGLADSIDDSKLREIFGAFGTVKDAFLKEGASGKFAFVTLETQEEAEKAGAGLGGKTTVEVNCIIIGQIKMAKPNGDSPNCGVFFHGQILQMNVKGKIGQSVREIEGSRLKVQWAKPRADGGGGRGGGRGGRGGGGGSSTCFGCGQSGHRKADCPGSGSAAGSSSTQDRFWQSSGWGDAAPAPATTSASSDGWGTTPASSDASAPADSGWGSVPAAPALAAPAGDTGGWGSAPASAPASAAPSGGWGDSAAATEPSGGGGWGSTSEASTASSGWGSSDAPETKSSGWGSGGGGGASSGTSGRPPRESRPMQGDPCQDDRNGGYKVHVVGLADSIDDSKLREMFGEFGSVKDAFLKEGASGKFAFVTLETQEQAEKAGAALGGKEIDGSRIKVQWAKPRAGGGGDRGGRGGGRGGGGSGPGTCFGCGGTGHRKADCPGSSSSATKTPSQSSSSAWGDAAPAAASSSSSGGWDNSSGGGGWDSTLVAKTETSSGGGGWDTPATKTESSGSGAGGWDTTDTTASASAAVSGWDTLGGSSASKKSDPAEPTMSYHDYLVIKERDEKLRQEAELEDLRRQEGVLRMEALKKRTTIEKLRNAAPVIVPPPKSGYKSQSFPDLFSPEQRRRAAMMSGNNRGHMIRREELMFSMESARSKSEILSNLPVNELIPLKKRKSPERQSRAPAEDPDSPSEEPATAESSPPPQHKKRKSVHWSAELESRTPTAKDIFFTSMSPEAAPSTSSPAPAPASSGKRKPALKMSPSATPAPKRTSLPAASKATSSPPPEKDEDTPPKYHLRSTLQRQVNRRAFDHPFLDIIAKPP